MRFFWATFLLMISGLTAPGLGAQTVVTYRVCLDQDQVVPQSFSSAMGDATVVLNTVTRNVTISGSYAGLGSNAQPATACGSRPLPSRSRPAATSSRTARASSSSQ